MDILDAIIAILLVGFAISGYRRGFTWAGSALAGLVVGSVVGALIAPPLTRWISPGPHSSGQPLVATEEAPAEPEEKQSAELSSDSTA